jgi:hypothetical protein
MSWWQAPAQVEDLGRQTDDQRNEQGALSAK